MGSISLPKGRTVWIFRTKIDGKEHRWSTGEANRQRALVKAEELERRAELLRGSPENSRRVADAAVRLVAEIEMDVSVGQAKRVADMLKNFALWIGPSAPLESIETETLLRYQRERVKTAAKSTVMKDVGAVLRLLRRNGLHVKKPPALKTGRETEIRPFEPRELGPFLDAVGRRRAECALILATGARPSEIVAVKDASHVPLLKEEIDWDNGRVLIRQSKLKPGEKAHSRWVPVEEGTLSEIRERVEATEGPRAFPRWLHMGRDFNLALKRAGIAKRDALGRELRMHSLRHTYCTLIAQQVTNALALSRLLGHKNVSTTERYYHGDPNTPTLPMAEIVDVGRIREVDTLAGDTKKKAANEGG